MIIVKVNLNKYLYTLLGRQELIDSWWHSPNKAFENKTPDEVYQSGEEGREKVAKYILGFIGAGYS
jgi:hypothetical protein